jgi:hypothetical protein
MTDLDDLPFEPDDSAEHRVVVLEREPRKHRRHRWVRLPFDSSEPTVEIPANAWHCQGCLKLKDEATSRRGKNSRSRGNAYEREVAAKLGGVRKGQFGDKVDVEVPGWIRVQCKNGGAYPERLDGWLRAIPTQADLLRAVVIGDAPGPGGRRRSLIVLDLEEFAKWYAR